MENGKDKPMRRNRSLSLYPGDALLHDLRSLIEETRATVATMVNAALTMLYWRIGKRINEEILNGDRAEYGAQIVSAAGRQLELEFGRGFSEKSLRHMIRFSEVFSDESIVSALRRQLSWTHFKAIIYLDDALKRDFYAEMCRVERWSTRTLQKKIGSMLYERTALSRKPEKLARIELESLREEDVLTPDMVFLDPYFEAGPIPMFKAESNVGQKLCQPADLVINTMWAWMSALKMYPEGSLTGLPLFIHAFMPPAKLWTC